MGRTENLQRITGQFRQELGTHWSGPTSLTHDTLPTNPDLTQPVDAIVIQAASLTMSQCFRLPEELWQTIAESGADPRDIIMVRNIEYEPMFQPPATHAMNADLPTILNWLRDIPPQGQHFNAHPPPDCSDWNEWWLRMEQHWQQRVESPHPLYHQLIQPEIINQIDNAQTKAAHRVVHAVVAHACTNEPTPIEIARLASAAPGSSPSLSTIHRTMHHVATIRRQAGLLPKLAPTPEEISQELRGQGINFEPDCGRLQRPEVMHRNFSPEQVMAMTADPVAQVWYSRPNLGERRQSTPDPSHRYDPNRPNQRPHEQAEKAIITNLAPDDPFRQRDLFHALSINYGISPAQAFAIATGRQKGPPDHQTVCPAIDQCASTCALRQRQGQTKMPSTWTGQYEDCAYYDYLAKSAETVPHLRAAVAEEWQHADRKHETDRPTQRSATRRRQTPHDQIALFS